MLWNAILSVCLHVAPANCITQLQTSEVVNALLKHSVSVCAGLGGSHERASAAALRE